MKLTGENMDYQDSGKVAKTHAAKPLKGVSSPPGVYAMAELMEQPITSPAQVGESYPDGVTERNHIAHDMRVGRFPKRSSIAEFLTERAPSAQEERSRSMSGYAAVNDAFRFVEKQDTLLKQVIRMQTAETPPADVPWQEQAAQIRRDALEEAAQQADAWGFGLVGHRIRALARSEKGEG